jgi:heme-degrading monooxygenase HmoA
LPWPSGAEILGAFSDPIEGTRMFARVSRYSGDADRLLAGFESVRGELEQLEGFTEAFFLTDRKTSRGMSITLWESEEALQASAERAHRMRTQASEPADATIEAVESYDVPLTVKPATRTG